MKIWLDDTQPAPKGYIWCQDFKETVYIIHLCESYSAKFQMVSSENFAQGNYNISKVHAYNANYMVIQKIAMAHEDSEYHKLIKWLNMTRRDYPVVLINKGEGK